MLKIIEKYDINIEKSLLIGDKDSDIECAKNVGINSIKFNGEKLNFIELMKVGEFY